MQATPNNLQLLLQNLAITFNSSLVGALVLFMAAMTCMLLIGNPMIAWLQNKRWKKGTTLDETWAVREDTPDSHQVKKGTPSMGGMGIIAATLAACFAVLTSLIFVIAFLNSFTPSWPFKGFETAALLLLPCVLLTHGALGFADDWSKSSGRGGLRARDKLAGQIFLALAFVAAVLLLTQYQFLTANRDVFPGIDISSSKFYLLIWGLLVFVVIATCNAVNLTDGIDGLAAGLAVQCGICLFLLRPPAGENYFVSDFFWIALAGACFGFLFFNKHKARVFMGDTGSLAIGAALGAGAILQGAVFLLPFIGFIYFVEMFSVIAQVLWFKWTKRKTGEGQRLFRRAPLHHHFELGGWSEWRVVGTFWAVNLFTSAIGLCLWHAGVLPRWP